MPPTRQSVERASMESLGAEWAAQLAAGKRSALEPLLLLHYDRLRLHASKLAQSLPAGHASSVDDILQETFARAFRAAERFTTQDGTGVLSWLKTIADNHVVDLRRQAARRRVAVRGTTLSEHHRAGEGDWTIDRLAELADSMTSPSGRAARNESIRTLRVALASLPDDYRRAIRLRYVASLTLEDIARKMGCSPAAARGILQRARQKLRDALGPRSL